MSFILDALRKSESERRRDEVPDVTRIPLAPAPLGLPRWVVPVTTLLGAAVIGLSVVLWYGARPDPDPAAAGDSADAATSSGRTATANLPGARAPAPGDAAPPPDTAQAPADRAQAQRPTSARSVVPLGELAAARPRETAREQPGSGSPADAAPPRDSAADTEIAAGLPRRSDLLARGIAVPELTLELHVYSPTPASRFVFVNGARYGEGETLSSGQDVVRITPQGVVLAHAGERFLLLPD